LGFIDGLFLGFIVEIFLGFIDGLFFGLVYSYKVLGISYLSGLPNIFILGSI